VELSNKAVVGQWLRAYAADRIVFQRRDRAERGSRGEFLRKHFGLFISNFDWQKPNYNLRLPSVCDGEYIRL
jgi:hypothetical protein